MHPTCIKNEQNAIVCDFIEGDIMECNRTIDPNVEFDKYLCNLKTGECRSEQQLGYKLGNPNIMCHFIKLIENKLINAAVGDIIFESHIHSLMCSELYHKLDVNEALARPICTKYGARISKSLIRGASSRVFVVPEQSIIEPIVNGFDSYLGRASSIGKFGMGFFSLLYWLLDHPRRTIIVDTAYLSNGNLLSYKFKIYLTDDQLYFQLIKSNRNRTGTTIRIDAKRNQFNESNIKKFEEYIHRLEYYEHVKLFYNKELINQSAINTKFPGIRVTLSRKGITVEDFGSGIDINVGLTSLLIPSISTKTISLSKTVETRELKSGLYPSTNNYFVITVGGVSVVKLHFITNLQRKYTVRIDMPLNTRLPVARDDIIYTEESLRVFYQELQKMLDLGIQNRDLSTIQKSIHAYVNFTSQTDVSSHIENFVNDYINDKIDNQIIYPLAEDNLNILPLVEHYQIPNLILIEEASIFNTEKYLIQELENARVNIDKNSIRSRVCIFVSSDFLNDNIYSTFNFQSIIFVDQDLLRDRQWQVKLALYFGEGVLSSGKISEEDDVIYREAMQSFPILQHMGIDEEDNKKIFHDVLEKSRQLKKMGIITEYPYTLSKYYSILSQDLYKKYPLICLKIPLCFSLDNKDLIRTQTFQLYYKILDIIKKKRKESDIYGSKYLEIRGVNEFSLYISDPLYALMGTWTREKYYINTTYLSEGPPPDIHFRLFNMESIGVDSLKQQLQTFQIPETILHNSQKSIQKIFQLYHNNPISYYGIMLIEQFINYTDVLFLYAISQSLPYMLSEKYYNVLNYLLEKTDNNLILSFICYVILNIFGFLLMETDIAQERINNFIRFDIQRIRLILDRLFDYAKIKIGYHHIEKIAANYLSYCVYPDISGYIQYIMKQPHFNLLSNYGLLLIDTQKDIEVIDKFVELGALEGTTIGRSNFNLSTLIDYTFVNNLPEGNTVKYLNEVSTWENRNLPLQLAEIAINEGSVRNVHESVIIELVQNSIDAIREYNVANKRIDVKIMLKNHRNGQSIVLIVTDYVGIEEKNLPYLMIPYLSSKLPQMNLAGEMGNGLFNAYRKSNRVIINTIRDGKNYRITDLPIIENDRVVDLNKKIDIYKTTDENKTNVIVEFNEKDRHMIVEDYAAVSEFIRNTLSLVDEQIAEIYYNNNRINSNIYQYQEGTGEFDIYLTSKKDLQSFVLTKGIPYRQMVSFLFELKNDGELENKTHLISLDNTEFSIVVNLLSGYEPVQSRSRMSINPNVKNKIFDLFYRFYFISGVLEIYQQIFDDNGDQITDKSNIANKYFNNFSSGASAQQVNFNLVLGSENLEKIMRDEIEWNNQIFFAHYRFDNQPSFAEQINYYITNGNYMDNINYKIINQHLHKIIQQWYKNKNKETITPTVGPVGQSSSTIYYNNRNNRNNFLRFDQFVVNYIQTLWRMCNDYNINGFNQPIPEYGGIDQHVKEEVIAYYQPANHKIFIGLNHIFSFQKDDFEEFIKTLKSLDRIRNKNKRLKKMYQLLQSPFFVSYFDNGRSTIPHELEHARNNTRHSNQGAHDNIVLKSLRDDFPNKSVTFTEAVNHYFNIIRPRFIEELSNQLIAQRGGTRHTYKYKYMKYKEKYLSLKNWKN